MGGLRDSIRKNKERKAQRNLYARRTGSIANAAQQEISDAEYERLTENSNGQPSVKFDEIGTGGASTFPAANVENVSVPQPNTLGQQNISAPTTEGHIAYVPKQEYVGADPQSYANDVRSRQLGGSSRFVQPKVAEQQVVKETQSQPSQVEVRPSVDPSEYAKDVRARQIGGSSRFVQPQAETKVVENKQQEDKSDVVEVSTPTAETKQETTEQPSKQNDEGGVEPMVIRYDGNGSSTATMKDGTQVVVKGDGTEQLPADNRVYADKENALSADADKRTIDTQSLPDAEPIVKEETVGTTSNGNFIVELEDGSKIEVTPEQKKKIDYDNLVNLAKSGASKDDVAQYLASNPSMYGYLMDAYRDAEEELDPNKKADRAKKEKIERNLVGLFSMIGALGNLYNATSTRDGRSVNVEPLSTAVSQKQEKGKAERKAKLDLYNSARLKYGDYLNNLYGGIKARKQKVADQQAAYEQQEKLTKIKKSGGLTPEQQEKLNNAKVNTALSNERAAKIREDTAKIQKDIQAGKLNGAELDGKMKQIKYNNAVLDYQKKMDDLNYVIPNPNGGTETIKKSCINQSTVGKAWDIIAGDKDLMKYIASTLEFKNEDGNKANGIPDFSSPKTNTFNVNENTIKLAIGIALNSGSEDVKNKLMRYLLSLDGNNKKHLDNPFDTGEGESGNNVEENPLYGDQ